MSRHVVFTQAEAVSSLNSFELGVLENFTFASACNKMMETEQKLLKVSTAKWTMFESVSSRCTLLIKIIRTRSIFY